MTKKLLAIVTGFVMLIVLMSGCVASSDIKVGVFQPLRGDFSEQGKLEWEGIQLAHSLYNTVTSEGTTQKIKLIRKDTQSLEAETTRVVESLIERYTRPRVKTRGLEGVWRLLISRRKPGSGRRRFA